MGESVSQTEKSVVNKVLRECLKVAIYQTDETGELLWAIESVDYPEFWIEAFPKFSEAKEFCKEYGLPYEIR